MPTLTASNKEKQALDKSSTAVAAEVVAEGDLYRIIEALAAVKDGDFSVRLHFKKNPLLQELADNFNTVVATNDAMTKEFVRVGRLVGREGRMTVRASLPAHGSWATMLNSYNALIGDLAHPTAEVARVISAVAEGDLSQKIPLEIGGRPVRGEFLHIGKIVNTMVDQLRAFAAEVTRVAREVGIEGKLGGQAKVPGVAGTWKDLTENVNGLASNLTNQVRNIALVTTAVANGDLSQKITVDASGEILELKNTINVMVDQLRAFAAEVTRVAKEVGTEGILGGQAKVPGVAGTWKDLTDNVNGLAGNLTNQVRNIALVTTAVANGDLSQKITVDARGEIRELKNTINVMVDQLRAFAAEVTRVAREVGIEGKLGGQARVPGVAGTWKDLTDNVNQLAGNLTSQVRAIAEVSTAVTKGDLTRFITVEAQGEVLALKDNINKMIANLKDTTEQNMEQDWLKTNLARFSSLMQGQKDLPSVCALIMSEVTPLVSAQYGAFFVVEYENDEALLKLRGSYAYQAHPGGQISFRLGEGLVGQCAVEKKAVLLSKVPADYIKINSGLGHAPPANILVLPVLFEGEVLAILELASFQPFSPIHRVFLDQLAVSIGVVLNIIGASMRTEQLLHELQATNSELEAQAKELEEKATLLEIKNREVELASQSLEEKAEQLAMISKYKSEFLANMSHELRTPLNSLLIMAKLLADNKDNNLSAKQIEFAKTIQASGRDLLQLIDEILDLSKVEAGKMRVVTRETPIKEIVDFVERDFRPVAEQKEIGFGIELDGYLPATIVTDAQRLQQILKNLLSNAFKFTEQGSVTLHIGHVGKDVRLYSENLKLADQILAFSVHDTGIGIAENKQRLIFEAFQQVDATTSRKYGGTGLGLTISREISRLLGGEIHVESHPGQGSTFTLYVPATYEGPEHELPDHDSDQVLSAPEEPVLSKPIFDGQKVLVVDDDVRNIFALTSLLEHQNLRVLFAENGKDAIRLLTENPDIELVLMDIMMPEMDGFETTQEIRKIKKYRGLPIIAVTAKAMKGDREKCLERGLSDYVTKPVEADRLLALIGGWLNRSNVAAPRSQR